MHTKINVLQYPVECELCKAMIENEQMMKAWNYCSECEWCNEIRNLIPRKHNFSCCMSDLKSLKRCKRQMQDFSDTLQLNKSL